MSAVADSTPVDEAIRSRRTHKVFAGEPLSDETIAEILELARWAPNHKLTNPWRFRVLGPAATQRLKLVLEQAQPGSGAKLDRAPTLICATVVLEGGAEQQREDMLSAAAACYIVLLAAHARGLAGYWRTVPAIDSPAGRKALGIADRESPIGLLHLGGVRQQQPAPQREPVERLVSFLD
jgi:nitroreductase